MLEQRSEPMGLRNFAAGRGVQTRAHDLIPGGCHTYAKGDDQFPLLAPPFIHRGLGSHVWDLDDNEFIEYGMGLRSVTLGHAHPRVLEAVSRQLLLGSNFGRPSPIESECAAQFLSLVPTAEMVKFCKDGSHALDGAIRLARAYTGRDGVAYCRDHPFFSTSDWFIGTTPMRAGTLDATHALSYAFSYNDIDSVKALFDQHPDHISCVVLEPARLEEPQDDYLHQIKQLCHAHGALLIFDEMITGFRWHNAGAQHLYHVTPDLSAFGKGMANGFALSALAGRRSIMELGGLLHPGDRVFLLSTTHGAETHAMAAAIATMKIYQDEPVIQRLHQTGSRLREGITEVTRQEGVDNHIQCIGRDCCLLYTTRDPDGAPSQAFRALFLQELIRHGILAPSFVVSNSHTSDDIDITIEAVRRAARVYRMALEEGVDHYLVGDPVKPVLRARN